VSPALEETLPTMGRPAAPVARLSRSAAGTGAGPRDPEDKERRLVSVLYAELSLRAPLGSKPDPEDLRSAVGSAMAGLIAEVEGLGGTVTSVSGAGLAAVFGAPETHEDDPERAVRAGLRLLAAVKGGTDASGRELLSVRAGVETGAAVVGRLWSGARGDYVAVGEAVHAAAALQSAARPWSVLVGPVTKASTEGIFEWGATEDVIVNPADKPLEAVYVARPKARAGLPSSRGVLGRQARLVGRQGELSALDEALRQATRGTGCVVFIVGEPGLGKTRLVQECRKRFMGWVGAGTGRLPLWLEGRGASFASTTPYGLYRQLLSAWVGVTPEEPEEVVRPALERAMKAIFGAEVEEVRFLAHIMGVQPGEYAERIARLSPEGLQRATFASVRSLVERLASRGPAVLVLEDLHWADPISLRLTGELAALTQSLPLLLVGTRRPEPDPGVSALESALENGSCTFRRVELSALSDEAEHELSRSMVGAEAADDVVAALRRNVDGNPLFLEQRFHSLVEIGALVKGATAWSLSGTGANDVPEVLERLIRSRVDRLSRVARQVVAAASVLGPEFPLSALTAVSERPGDLAAAVSELCRAGLLLEPRGWPEPAYRFRHALIQEAIYSGLLRGQRTQLHARAAWGLEAICAERLEEVAAILGHHYAMAGENERAAHHLCVAARHAAANFAIEEAIASYRGALRIVDSNMARAGGAVLAVELRAELAEVLWRNTRLAEARDTLREALVLVGPGRPLQAAKLQARLGRVEVESGYQGESDHCHQAALAAFDAAEELLGEYTDERSDEWVDTWLEVLIDGRANLHNWRCEPDRAREALARARPVAEALGSPSRRAGLFMQLMTNRNIVHGWGGEEGVALMRQSVQAAEEGSDEHVLAICLTGLGNALLRHGELAEAGEKFEAGLAVAERIDNPQIRSWCLCQHCLLEIRRHDVEAVRSLSRQARAAANSAGMTLWLAAASAAEAWVAWKDSRPQEVVRLACEVRELSRDLAQLPREQIRQFEGPWLWPLVSVHLGSGELAMAVQASCQVLDPTMLGQPVEQFVSLVGRAKDAWDQGQENIAAKLLSEVVELASELGVC